ncbi:predicted protein [Arabidopsis lyrata subsp. lyrata]|uniref:Predicted protein n=1 Tax=Arabidopsis lyrata subsp. lyrata TaxID=81972 RepID=D7MLN1_ARALL|nr:predicted protein [Arabidopsis lyrata subsp. lyrata]
MSMTHLLKPAGTSHPVSLSTTAKNSRTCTAIPTSGLGKQTDCNYSPQEDNCHIRNLQHAFANASFSPTDKGYSAPVQEPSIEQIFNSPQQVIDLSSSADESTVEFTTPTVSVTRKSVERKAVTQTINLPKKRGRPRLAFPTKRAVAKAKKTC